MLRHCTRLAVCATLTMTSAVTLAITSAPLASAQPTTTVTTRIGGPGTGTTGIIEDTAKWLCRVMKRC